jgi:hypothetical protein
MPLSTGDLPPLPRSNFIPKRAGSARRYPFAAPARPTINRLLRRETRTEKAMYRCYSGERIFCDIGTDRQIALGFDLAYCPDLHEIFFHLNLPFLGLTVTIDLERGPYGGETASIRQGDKT